jgi:UDP-glucuronate decarboxylase
MVGPSFGRDDKTSLYEVGVVSRHTQRWMVSASCRMAGHEAFAPPVEPVRPRREHHWGCLGGFGSNGPSPLKECLFMRQYNAHRRILVTGGAGFLGSHLIDRLIARGDEVICVDNLFTGSKRNIAHLHGHPRFEFMRHDVTFPLYLEVDQIFNLACPASPIHYQHDPVQTTKTSVHGAINMLGLAKRIRARILQASTSEVYGDPSVHPQREHYWGNVNPIGIRSCYDEGKRCAETLFFDYHRQHRLDIRVARIFNTYGPRMHPNDGRVVSNFIVQALKGEDITLYGDGLQTRSFCYVDDLIEGLLRFMDLPQPEPGAPGFPGPMNIGNPGEFTIRELAERIIELTGSASRLSFRPLPQDDPMQRCPDISLARQLLDGWAPAVRLDEGLRRTIDYFDTVLAGRSRASQQSPAGLEALGLSG